jgi:hypothetical protein
MFKDPPIKCSVPVPDAWKVQFSQFYDNIGESEQDQSIQNQLDASRNKVMLLPIVSENPGELPCPFKEQVNLHLKYLYPRADEVEGLKSDSESLVLFFVILN